MATSLSVHVNQRMRTVSQETIAHVIEEKLHRSLERHVSGMDQIITVVVPPAILTPKKFATAQTLIGHVITRVPNHDTWIPVNISGDETWIMEHRGDLRQFTLKSAWRRCCSNGLSPRRSSKKFLPIRSYLWPGTDSTKWREPVWLIIEDLAPIWSSCAHSTRDRTDSGSTCDEPQIL